jgi:phosphatidylserine decarboxylase
MPPFSQQVNLMIKLASEGYPFIIGSLLLTIVVLFAFPPATCIPLLLTAFMLYFFRDPSRNIPTGKGLFVSPADGAVVLIRDTPEEKYLHADVKQISIFMSPFNVHVNRAPCDGIVKIVNHNKGTFVAAYKEEASVRNENIEMVLETEHGDILVRQVAGLVARRAVCRKKERDELRRGERYGIIKFSSRVDLYLPKDAVIKVEIHDKVIAGETVLAELKS